MALRPQSSRFVNVFVTVRECHSLWVDVNKPDERALL